MQHDLQQHLRTWQRVRLAAPPLELSPAKQQAFDTLLATAAQSPQPHQIDYAEPYPKHEFLRYVVEKQSFLAHGSRNPNITVFEPIRASSDTVAFGQQAAVYAASDGIWPMVFAILDRQVYHGIFYNECSRVLMDGQWSEPYYAFVIEAAALRRQPWTNGTLYLLPRESFVSRPPVLQDGLTICYQEWVSHGAVRPVAKLAVSPGDFPFLTGFWGFDVDVLLARMGSYPPTWPFGALADEQLYPVRPTMRSSNLHPD